MSRPPRIVVSAAGSSSGKTLVTLALCAALRDAGLRVRAYKTGPDYIDARLYAVVLGQPAHNLDLWLDGAAGVRAHVAATSADADVVVIEGMMGLFDGDDAGLTSTGALARVLDAGVVTVLDGWTASQTLAAVALGLRAYDSQVRHLGSVVNRAGGEGHVAAVRDACARAGIDVLAAVPTRPAYALPERLLGLDRAAVLAKAGFIDELGASLAAQIDLPALVAAAGSGADDVRDDANPARNVVAHERPARTADTANERAPLVAYADDDAFWFTYPETLDALRGAGARLVPFSPLRDRELPAGVRALWIGGGYPEDHAAALAANVTLRRAIRSAVADGLPTYAECGGLMYLAQTLHTADGAHPMVGAIAGATSMREPRLQIGYRDAAVVTSSPLDAAGEHVRAYEFHYATAELAAPQPAYAVGDRTDGAVTRRCVGAFFHRHFVPGDPAVTRFVAAATAA